MKVKEIEELMQIKDKIFDLLSKIFKGLNSIEDELNRNTVKFIEELNAIIQKIKLSTNQEIAEFLKFNKRMDLFFLDQYLYKLSSLKYPNFMLCQNLLDLGANINAPLNRNCSEVGNSLEKSLISLYCEQVTMLISDDNLERSYFDKGVRWVYPLFLMLQGGNPNEVRMKGCLSDNLYGCEIDDSVKELFHLLRKLKDQPEQQKQIIDDVKYNILHIPTTYPERMQSATLSTKKDILRTLFILREKGRSDKSINYSSIKKPLVDSLLQLDCNNMRLITVLRNLDNHTNIFEAVKKAISNCEMVEAKRLNF